MAKYNEILVGRYNRYLQRLLSMKGDPPAPQLAGEIAPQFEIEQIAAELRFLMQFDRYIGGPNSIATGGVTSSTQIDNPASSGVIAVIEKWQISTDVATRVDLSVSYAAITAETNVFAMVRVDGRTKNTNCPIRISSGTGFTSLPTGVGGFYLPANSEIELVQDQNQELVISPGQSWRIVTTAVLVNLYTVMIVRVRALEEGELS
jgi:hypothetical protein